MLSLRDRRPLLIGHLERIRVLVLAALQAFEEGAQPYGETYVYVQYPVHCTFLTDKPLLRARVALPR